MEQLESGALSAEILKQLSALSGQWQSKPAASSLQADALQCLGRVGLVEQRTRVQLSNSKLREVAYATVRIQGFAEPGIVMQELARRLPVHWQGAEVVFNWETETGEIRLTARGEAVSQGITSREYSVGDLAGLLNVITTQQSAEWSLAVESMRLESSDSDWPTISQAAKDLGKNKGQLQPLINRGELKDNGKKGADRRVDPASMIQYARKHGIAINNS